MQQAQPRSTKKSKSKGKSRARAEDTVPQIQQYYELEPEPEPEPESQASTQYNSLPIIRSQPEYQQELEPKIEYAPPHRDPTPPPIRPTIPTIPKGLALPAPDSAEWESFDLPPPPAPPSARKSTRTKAVEESTPRRKTRSRAVAE